MAPVDYDFITQFVLYIGAELDQLTFVCKLA